MSNAPRDPSQNSIEQHERHSETFDGQQGHGVSYEHERFQSDDTQAPPPEGRSGSYESSNIGGYGTSAPDAQSEGAAHDPATLPPDPEALQGQGGQ